MMGSAVFEDVTLNYLKMHRAMHEELYPPTCVRSVVVVTYI